MRAAIFTITLALTASFTFISCTDPSKAQETEKSGDIAKAVRMYTAVARRAASAIKFPDSKQGKVIAPARWQDLVERYLNSMSEPGTKPNNSLTAALDGLGRCMELRENDDNSAQIHPPRPLDENSFTDLFNKIFVPPPAGSTEWGGIAASAFKKNFSVLQISSPVNYTYKGSVINRSTSRRIDFTLYPESVLQIPLTAGDYSVVARSSVTFQKGKVWNSEFTAFTVSIPSQPSLVAMDLRTRAARRQ